MSKIHEIKDVRFNNDTMFIVIDGKSYSFKLSKISKRLLNATKEQREEFIISASGYGIRWPSIDEDLSIDGLLRIRHNPKFNKRKIIF